MHLFCVAGDGKVRYGETRRRKSESGVWIVARKTAGVEFPEFSFVIWVGAHFIISCDEKSYGRFHIALRRIREKGSGVEFLEFA